MRRLPLMVVATILVGVVGVLAWAAFTERVSYVITNGVSMQPLYHAGDLVVVTKKDSYQEGDIVAYHVKNITVLHRIIGGDPAGGFDIKGDNNQSTDPAHPTGSEIFGSAAVHIPQGGVWLRRASSSPVVAAVAFILLFATGRTVRRKRGKRRATVQKTSGPVSFTGLVAAVSTPRLRIAGGLIAAVALLAVCLGALAWAHPTTNVLTVQPSTARSMAFSYRTTVPASAAYDGTLVTAPDPVFRKVADTVNVTFAYKGPPGQVVVDAELSIPNGWHSTVKLAAARPITSGADPTVVRLDLDALAARASAGAKATGGSAGVVSIAVVPRVTSGTGEPFAPVLNLQLTPLALNLRTAGGSLTVADAAPAPTKASVAQVFQFGGRDLVRVSAARVISAGMLLGAILAAVAFFLLIRRSPQPPEDEQIRQRHGPLLVEVRPMEAPADRPAVQVTQFETLARLAQRYGLLVLHWPDGDGTTYTVHDDAADYRYSTGTAGPPEAVPDGPPRPAHAAPDPIEFAGGDPFLDYPIEDTDTTAEEIAELEVPTHWELELALTGAKDELTELANRSLFEDEVQYSVDNGGVDARLCLMLIDVDDLASINEEFGREAGDAVLIGIAERLRRTVRPRDLVARLEGDDFGVLFENVGPAAVDSIAKRVMRVLQESMPVRDRLMQIRVSIGVVRARPGQDATELMRHGRSALVEAKNTHNAHYAWFAEDHIPKHG